MQGKKYVNNDIKTIKWEEKNIKLQDAFSLKLPPA